MTLSLNPVYNLKAVLKETGIKPDVLRAWERRYGLPMPHRTDGGHRLYSEHDIEVIKWLIARQSEGLSISHAVEMWMEKSSQGMDPLAVVLQGSGKKSPLVFPGEPLPKQHLSTMIDELRSAWLLACLNFDETAADQALNQAFALYPLEFVCTEMLQRGMVEIGALWYQDRASVQQEHFASELALRRLNVLLMASPAATRLETIILGCPANEWHTFTTLLMALLLRRRGYNVIYLGANIPDSHFIETIHSSNADLVVLAAQQLNTVVTLRSSATRITKNGSPVAFGGRIFSIHPDLASRVSGHYLGNSLEGALEMIESLLVARAAPMEPAPPSDEYVLTLKAFTARRALLEASFDQRIAGQDILGEYFTVAHRYFGDNIISALSLGSLAYLDSEIDWLQVMLQGHKLPENILYEYLDAYSKTVKQQLDGQAKPLTEWLERQLHLRKGAS